MKLNKFTVSNFKSFLTVQTVVFNGESNVSVFIGPNNSGKSNLFQAISLFKSFIQNSSSFQSGKELIQPFAYNSENIDQPTTFAAELQTNKNIYFYSFSIKNNNITNEVLRKKSVGKSKTYSTIFSRLSMNKNRYEKYGFDSKLLNSTRDDTLVLTKAFENNNKYALEVFDWLEHLKPIAGNQEPNTTARLISEDETFKTKALALLKRANLYIHDIESTRLEMPEEAFNQLPFTKNFKSKLDRTVFDIKTTHLIHNKNGLISGTIAMPLIAESTGTLRIFELLYPIINTLENGNILYIDEFETHLHPNECMLIIDLFKSPENAKNAQLIVNTHNTQVLSVVGRDNINLVGKNNREETEIGKIPKTIREDDGLLEKKYLKGMFGAVPNIQK